MITAKVAEVQQQIVKIWGHTKVSHQYVELLIISYDFSHCQIIQ